MRRPRAPGKAGQLRGVEFQRRRAPDQRSQRRQTGRDETDGDFDRGPNVGRRAVGAGFAFGGMEVHWATLTSVVMSGEAAALGLT